MVSTLAASEVADVPAVRLPGRFRGMCHLRAVLVTALSLAACADPGAKGPDDTAEADADTDTDVDADTDADVVAPATDGTLDLPFALDAEGAGADRLDGVTLLDASGTLELDGVTHLAVAYQDHDWVEAGYHLYDVLSIPEDGSNLAVTYLYCQDDALPYAYTESFLHPMDWEATTGTCDGAAASSSAAVSFPALRARPAAFDPGVRIDGEEVAYDGTTGHVRLDGVDRALHPFNTVDCTDCPGGPWLEVHSLFEGDDDACFGILYLYPDDPTYVQVYYTMCLPTFARPTGALTANWTGAPSGPPRPPGLRRPRPPRIPPVAAGE